MPASEKLNDTEIRRALRLSIISWVFGSVWLYTTAGVPLANYAQALQINELQKGILASLPFLATLLSLPASLLIERTGQRKRIFLWALYFQRLMWLPIAWVPYWMVRHYGQAVTPHAMGLFLILILLMHTGQAVGGPAWTSWMADIIPGKIRGIYFGRRRQWGMILTIPAAVLVGWLLDRYSSTDPLQMMWWCAMILMVSAVFGTIDIALFHFVPEIPQPRQKSAHLLRAWRDPLRNSAFMWFAGYVAAMMFAISFMGQFVIFYIIEYLGDSISTSRIYGLNLVTQLMVIVVPGVAQILCFSAWGRAVDRMGKKPVIILAGLGMVPVGLGWCLVTRQTLWLGYVLGALGALFWAGIEVANFNMVMKWSGSGDNKGGGSGYVAINSVIINIAGFLGGIVGGIIGQYLKDIDWQWVTSFKTFTFYDALFAFSGLFRLLSIVIFVPHIREPAAAPTRLTLRYMTANIYNNLQTAALQPLRFMRLKQEESYPLHDQPDDEVSGSAPDPDKRG